MNPTPPKALQALPVRQTSAWHVDVSRQQMIVSKLALRRTLGSDLKRVDAHVPGRQNRMAETLAKRPSTRGKHAA